MPWSHDPTVQTLRLTYNAAVGAHAACARAITDATMRGEIPSQQLLESENKARLRFNSARKAAHRDSRALLAAESRPPQCAYVLSDSLSYRCSLPAGHEGNHYVEAGDPQQVPSLPRWTVKTRDSDCDSRTSKRTPPQV